MNIGQSAAAAPAAAAVTRGAQSLRPGWDVKATCSPFVKLNDA